MIIHNFDPILIDFGFLQIRWYSLAYILGILFGWFYSIRIIKLTQENEFNFKQITLAQLDQIIIYLVLGIIIGGRLGYIFFYDLKYYTQNYFEIIKIWKGGMSFHGGLAGLTIAVILYSKKIKVNFFKFTDLISCVAPIGIFLGRIANFINGELYGKATDVPWGVIFPDAGNFLRHPSQIYEAILEGFILFLIINYVALKKKILFKPGITSSLFLIFYSILRIFSEFFREPDVHLGLMFGHFSMGIILSIITIIIGIFIFLLKRKNE